MKPPQPWPKPTATNDQIFRSTYDEFKEQEEFNSEVLPWWQRMWNWWWG